MHSSRNPFLSFLTLSCSSRLFQHRVLAQQVAQDPGVFGPPLERVHSYFDEWPTGTFTFIHGKHYIDAISDLD